MICVEYYLYVSLAKEKQIINQLISTTTFQKAIALSQLHFTLGGYQIEIISNEKGELEVQSNPYFKKIGINTWKGILSGTSGERLFNQAIQLDDLRRGKKAIEQSLPELLQTDKIEKALGLEEPVKILKQLI